MWSHVQGQCWMWCARSASSDHDSSPLPRPRGHLSPIGPSHAVVVVVASQRLRHSALSWSLHRFYPNRPWPSSCTRRNTCTGSRLRFRTVIGRPVPTGAPHHTAAPLTRREAAAASLVAVAMDLCWSDTRFLARALSWSLSNSNIKSTWQSSCSFSRQYTENYLSFNHGSILFW